MLIIRKVLNFSNAIAVKHFITFHDAALIIERQCLAKRKLFFFSKQDTSSWIIKLKCDEPLSPFPKEMRVSKMGSLQLPTPFFTWVYYAQSLILPH